MKLPPQDWMARPGAQAVLAALDAVGGATRIVGGAVRDALLGLPVNDIDLATRLVPTQVIARLVDAGLKAIPTGIAHGTITAIADDQVFEVTTLRRDVTTDGRHGVVEFSNDWREDARRRDFTMNALYANPETNEISDFFGGIADLHEHRVRFIGMPLERIAEDHLRILRFFRFHARFGVDAPDAAGLAACEDRANDLMALSRERVRGEVFKLLAVADPVATVRVMLERGILTPVLPEIAAVEQLARVVAVEAALGLEAGPLRRLAALLPVEPGVLDAVATRLRMSNVERMRLVASASRSVSALEQAYRDGADSALDRLALEATLPPGRETNALCDVLRQWTKPRVPVSGKDLIARGVTPGPLVSRKLGAFERAWIAAGFPQGPVEVEALLAAALA